MTQEAYLCVFELLVRFAEESEPANMIRNGVIGLIGFALAGCANAAGAGSKEEYASGAVHHRIMEIKMVS